MKLFSTSSLLIPIKLRMITTIVRVKIVLWLFRESCAKKEVIFDSSCFLINIFSLGMKLIRDGSNVKVITNDVIKPRVIIQPKSIIGFISLKIKDKKAIIVVKAVYKIGQNILLVVKEISSTIFLFGWISLICKILYSYEYS